MKTKLTILLLCLATVPIIHAAQEDPLPPNRLIPAPETPPATSPPDATPTRTVTFTPPVPVPAPTPASAPAEPAGAAPAAPTPPGDAAPANPNDIVPLIVIDEVPLTDAIRNLARQSSLNFQFDPRITATGMDGKPTNQPNVSIRFENVTAGEALQAVLDNYNLTLVKDSKTRIARITIKDPKAEEPLVSKIVQLKYGDPTNLVTLVRSSLSTRSQVVADPRTRQLLITTTEREADTVMALIEKLDSATRQVLIEAHILETTKNPTSIKGIDWSGTLEAHNFTFGNNAVGTTPAFAGGGTPPAPPTPQILGGALSTPRLLATTSGGLSPATAFLNSDGVSAVLSFLNKDSDTEVVSTPRAVTLDNQMATLSVTRAFPVFQITPGSANSPAGATITYTNLGTILQVTPRIAANNNISLKLAPEVSNIDSIDRQTLNGTVNTANIYAVRRIETSVLIPSGNTLVMGGLISDTSSKGHTKVPLMGDLPGVGTLFRSSSKKRNKSNLIIFVTPTVVSEGDFHLASSGTEYLQNSISPKAEVPANAWDSAKPHDWTKPAN